MARKMTEWHSKRGPISKIRPSDGCGRDAVLLVVERWYDFPEFGGYLGNVGLRISWESPFTSPLTATSVQTRNVRLISVNEN